MRLERAATSSRLPPLRVGREGRGDGGVTMRGLFVGADLRLWESRTRSIRMDGMVTSLRLETLFWMKLEEIAASEDMNLPQLLTRLYDEAVEEGRSLSNFASFLRVCCLRFADAEATSAEEAQGRARTPLGVGCASPSTPRA